MHPDNLIFLFMFDPDNWIYFIFVPDNWIYFYICSGQLNIFYICSGQLNMYLIHDPDNWMQTKLKAGNWRKLEGDCNKPFWKASPCNKQLICKNYLDLSRVLQQRSFRAAFWEIRFRKQSLIVRVELICGEKEPRGHSQGHCQNR